MYFDKDKMDAAHKAICDYSKGRMARVLCKRINGVETLRISLQDGHVITLKPTPDSLTVEMPAELEGILHEV